jgi:hypothetical protein
MYGDYDGVIVKPHEAGRENLISWMADATTLSYFVEKVHNGNQHHEVWEFDEAVCKDTILQHFIDRFEIYDLKPFLKESMDMGLDYDDIESDFDEKLALFLGCHQDNLKDTYNRKYAHKYLRNRDEVNFDTMIKMLTDVLDASFENEWVFNEWMNDHEFYDVERTDYSSYTHQIKWQHECLLWWSRHVIEESRKEHAEKLLKQVDSIVAHHGEVKVMSEMNYLKGKSDERANIKDFIVLNAVISGKDDRIDINMSKEDYKKLME